MTSGMTEKEQLGKQLKEDCGEYWNPKEWDENGISEAKCWGETEGSEQRQGPWAGKGERVLVTNWGSCCKDQGPVSEVTTAATCLSAQGKTLSSFKRRFQILSLPYL